MLFCIGNQTLIVKSEFYYVPDCKVWFISPQNKFKRSTDITGEFICNEDQTKQNIWVHHVLKIEYDSKNYLPIAIAYSAVLDSASINICITDGKN